MTSNYFLILKTIHILQNITGIFLMASPMTVPSSSALLRRPEPQTPSFQPSTPQPSTSQPSTSQPSTSQPSTSQPNTLQPSSSHPSVDSPSITPSTSSVEPSSWIPSSSPTNQPTTSQPSTAEPSTFQPSSPKPSTSQPTSTYPSRSPSTFPSTLSPSSTPSGTPSTLPSHKPTTSQPTTNASSTLQPSVKPSSYPTVRPSSTPSVPFVSSNKPSSFPSKSHSGMASSSPSTQPTSSSIRSTTTSMPSSYPSSAPSSGIPTFFYPDFAQGTCTNYNKDGNARHDNLRRQPDISLSIFDSLTECCETYFTANVNKCLGIDDGVDTGSELYYPSWENGEDVCKSDGNQPEWMNASDYMVETLEDCCSSFFGYKYKECMGSYTHKWYIDWVTYTCVEDCEDGPSCGGMAMSYDQLYEDIESCCKSPGMQWREDECLASSVGLDV